MDDKKKAAPIIDIQKVFGRSPDQHILNVVRESCQDAFSLPSFADTLQTIKSHFFARNYDAVFQNPAHLPVYSARYAPSRALCYYHTFLEHPVLMKILEGGPSTILCIGSGAGSELVGISAAMVHANPAPKTKKKAGSDKKGTDTSVKRAGNISKEKPPAEEDAIQSTSDGAILGLEGQSLTSSNDNTIAEPESTEGVASKIAKSKKMPKSDKHQVTIVIQDYVDWSTVLTPMETVVRARMKLGPERLHCETEIGNVLDLSEGLLDRVAKADLITFLFVLNELFQDKKRTMLLVAKMVAAMPQGAHMLVVDSAGSFSNLRVGERTYMVYMLLDHLKDLEIVYQDDAIWYRCPPGVTYPLKLENMRHFIRIYRKL
ncbi:hypothetical protein BGZ65_000432 [Modicella reniformis]|uniref:Uncharacterized protein n=1 Tax=Modicella reniformis TaxID=1440133 RepID=A0A9P6SQ18_9FUNG|nr:hypothetical protein BGZ65_000432 [Modicella reniformis]